MKTQLINENFTSNWVDSLLVSRGVDPSILEDFYHPSIMNLQDPIYLENIEDGAAYILNAAKQNKKIGILQDCDVDGLTSSSLIYHFLKELNPDLDIFTTFHSHKQHGLEDSWERFVEAGCELVIEPDAGINDKPYHDLLGEHGIFTVVADHHEYEGGGFSDYAIYIDNQTSPNYENKSLAGCGVAWQLCRMIDDLNESDYAFKYIDLVALGCSADVMSPMTLENRFIFDYGFSHLEDPTFKAIVAKQEYSMKGNVNYTSVAFYVAPLINACMRSGTNDEKKMMYSMMLDPTQMVVSNKRGAKGEIVPITEECIRILTNVKARQQRLIDNYTDIFEGRLASEGLNDNNILVFRLRDEDDFDSELNGLIAMKFSGKYHKPCIIIRDGLDNETKGSMRNPNGSPIVDLKALIAESPYTTFTAGHANAAGLGIKTPCVDKFIDWFNDKTSDLDFGENCYQVNFEVDAYCDYFKDMCMALGNCEQFWGGNNPQPVISLKNVHINPKQIQFMGSKMDTIKINVGGVDCMIFRNADLVKKWSSITDEIVINCIGHASINEWMGKRSPQLMIDDFDWHINNLLDF